MEISPSELRKDIYNLLDKILETGIPLEIKRKGKKLIIIPSEPLSKLDKLESHPDCIVGDPDGRGKIECGTDPVAVLTPIGLDGKENGY